MRFAPLFALILTGLVTGEELIGKGTSDKANVAVRGRAEGNHVAPSSLLPKDIAKEDEWLDLDGILARDLEERGKSRAKKPPTKKPKPKTTLKPKPTPKTKSTSIKPTSIKSTSVKPTHSTSSSTLKTTTTSTPTPTAKTTPYLVYPKKPTDKVGNAKLKKLLSSYVKNPKIELKESGIKNKLVNYWKLPLNATSYKTLSRNKQIQEVVRADSDCKGKNCYDPTVAAHSEKAEPELVWFAQREGTTLDQYGENFHYDNDAGTGVTCYIIDNGFDTSTSEFSDIRPRWLYPDDAEAKDKTETETGDKHGTCMLSKYVGKKFGIAKHCNPVLVKVAHGAPRSVWLSGLSKIVEDVQAKRPRKAVLSMSIYWPEDDLKNKDTKLVDDGWITSVHANLAALVEAGVTIVAASGNQGKGQLSGAINNMDGFPALMGSMSTKAEWRIPSMIVVGAMNAQTNKIWRSSNFDDHKRLPHVFAPGEQVKCQKGKGEPSVVDGTSPATASVAGLAAYYHSISSGHISPAAMKTRIIGSAWNRGEGRYSMSTGGGRTPIEVFAPAAGLLGVWNEMDVPDLPPTREDEPCDSPTDVGCCGKFKCIIFRRDGLLMRGGDWRRDLAGNGFFE